MALGETIRREWRYFSTAVRMIRSIRHLREDLPITAADHIEGWARRTPDRPALRFEGRRWSWAEFDGECARVARWARAQGLKRGDTVALMMENRPEYLFAQYGLAKLGVCAALINPSLQGRSLAHALSVSEARHLILGVESHPAYDGARDQLTAPPTLWARGDGAGGAMIAGAEDLDAALAAESDAPAGPELREGAAAKDACILVYTSGTTGAPKAARISHMRYLAIAHGFAAATRMRADDVMYTCLPLYHSTGGVCAVGGMMVAGGTNALARRFSARRFWDDIVEMEATAFVYIGELCRYLVNAPETESEKRHKLRMAFGNGMREDVWNRLTARFGLRNIIEFYGATEGNTVLFNADSTPGAIGRIPWYLKWRMNLRLVRFDVEAGEAIRAEDGFCRECAVDEVGEAIGRIPDDPNVVIGRYEGYTNREASEKKVLRDVFAKGDRWFRTGDLMRQDARGYLYFVDRIGDTFRWKSENVATNEVADALARYPGVSEATVYGVAVPAHEGRAGMATLCAANGLDLADLRAYLARELPPYARPLFLRQRSELDATTTFKLRKTDLVDQGFDPAACGDDPLWFDDPRAGGYVRLTPALYQEITSGGLRL